MSLEEQTAPDPRLISGLNWLFGRPKRDSTLSRTLSEVSSHAVDFRGSEHGVNFYRSSSTRSPITWPISTQCAREMSSQCNDKLSWGPQTRSPAPGIVGAGGVVGSGVSFRVAHGSSTEGRLVYDPEHVLADETGYVRHPDIDLFKK